MCEIKKAKQNLKKFSKDINNCYKSINLEMIQKRLIRFWFIKLKI